MKCVSVFEFDATITITSGKSLIKLRETKVLDESIWKEYSHDQISFQVQFDTSMQISFVLPLMYPYEPCKAQVHATALNKPLLAELKMKIISLSCLCAEDEREAMLDIITLCQEEIPELMKRQEKIEMKSRIKKDSRYDFVY